jgi:hypothetical protein
MAKKKKDLEISSKTKTTLKQKKKISKSRKESTK